MWSEPVTLGGGMTIEKHSSPGRAGAGAKSPRSSQ